MRKKGALKATTVLVMSEKKIIFPQKIFYVNSDTDNFIFGSAIIIAAILMVRV